MDSISSVAGEPRKGGCLIQAAQVEESKGVYQNMSICAIVQCTRCLWKYFCLLYRVFIKTYPSELLYRVYMKKCLSQLLYKVFMKIFPSVVQGVYKNMSICCTECLSKHVHLSCCPGCLWKHVHLSCCTGCLIKSSPSVVQGVYKDMSIWAVVQGVYEKMSVWAVVQGVYENISVCCTGCL